MTQHQTPQPRRTTNPCQSPNGPVLRRGGGLYIRWFSHRRFPPFEENRNTNCRNTNHIYSPLSTRPIKRTDSVWPPVGVAAARGPAVQGRRPWCAPRLSPLVLGARCREFSVKSTRGDSLGARQGRRPWTAGARDPRDTGHRKERT